MQIIFTGFSKISPRFIDFYRRCPVFYPIFTGCNNRTRSQVHKKTSRWRKNKMFS